MGWNLMRHWAELALFIAVMHMFEDCHGVMDALKVVRDADDLTRLGMVAACSIAAHGLAGLAEGVAEAFGLGSALRWVLGALRRLRDAFRRRRGPNM